MISLKVHEKSNKDLDKLNEEDDEHEESCEDGEDANKSQNIGLLFDDIKHVESNPKLDNALQEIEAQKTSIIKVKYEGRELEAEVIPYGPMKRSQQSRPNNSHFEEAISPVHP